MKAGRSAPRDGVNLILMAVLFTGVAVSLLPPSARAQGSAGPKAVLVLYWYNKDYPANIVFDQSFQARLKSAPGVHTSSPAAPQSVFTTSVPSLEGPGSTWTKSPCTGSMFTLH